VYDLVIVGAGPAGLSAACHAKKNGLKVLVLEKGELANTIHDYQKGKHVMAEPNMIPLRSDVPFQPGTREFLLKTWTETVQAAGVTIQRPEEVKSLVKSGGEFTIKTSRGEYASKYIILAIGVQGNPRTLNVPGATLPHVSTKLADPSIYENEDILMVGAGDAAIEGVLALCEKNRVGLVNRNSEFYRLKDALYRDIAQKVDTNQVTAFHSAAVERVEEGYTYIKLPDQTVRFKADLVFVRIGAEIPRPFLEKIGIAFASSSPSAPPVLSKQHETNIPGLFMIGAVAGYGLIKQGMNQGYDVVEHLLGRPVEPVEEPIIREERLGMLTGTTDERLAAVRATIPLLADVPDAALRELILASTVRRDVQAGTVIYRENDYSDSLFFILRGRVEMTCSAQATGDKPALLEPGDFFGEMSLLSGLRRSETVKATDLGILIETPRRAVLRLLNTEPSVRRGIDESFIVRALQLYLLPDAHRTFLRSIASRSTTSSYKQGEVVFKEGDQADAFYLVRSGSMKVSKRSGPSGKEVVVNHLPVGRYFGEIALLDPERPTRTATVTATKFSEAIRIKKKDFLTILERYPEFEKQLKQNMQKYLIRGLEVSLREIGEDHLINRLLESGVFEGTDVLLIDEDKCVRCDQCVNACANTHGGQTRLYRTEGIIFGHLLVPTSCRHCENPMCMTDCPPGNAIMRDPKGEVFIHADRCIGCGNCAKNCPYGNIFMVHETKQQPLGPLDRLLAMLGAGDNVPTDEGPTKAVKCDLCKHLAHGPACVRICPTGAAIRVSPNEYFRKVGVGAL
jgi:thioredoxin reductase/CRP-like cAMP-binding protein/Fe-S-cluster-containing hydrogenase component 2